MRASHPLAYLCFSLTKHPCKIFLAKTFLSKNLMYAVDYLK